MWVRDAAEGYIQGRITEIGAKEFEVTPTDRKYPKRTCHYDDIHSSCDGPQDHDDNCKYFQGIKFKGIAVTYTKKIPQKCLELPFVGSYLAKSIYITVWAKFTKKETRNEVL